MRDRLKRRSLNTKNIEDISEDETDDDVDNKCSEALFMVQLVEEKETEPIPVNDDKDEGEINFEAELISALDDLDDKRRKYEKISRFLNIKNEEVNILTGKLEESKKTTNELDEQLSLKVIENNALTEKIFSLKLQLEEQELKIQSFSLLQEELIKLKEIQKMMEIESHHKQREAGT
ncbi:hypothetical protein NE237_028367 [Protea cynaroides]|uniref:Uncharacterized protein n=1 Tax=Protea cynaroides TaxID=273540 RepID=A0A9Q0GS91_9MAGN|nr:hypothetical protein NE237_028367 [Protea cynaroides]